MNKTTPKNILISRTDGIGDVVLTLPMVGFLKNRFPNARIYFLGRTYTQPIVEACSHIHSFLNWDEWCEKTTKEQVATLQELNIEVCIHVFPRKEIALLTKKAKIPIRVGTLGRSFHFFTCNRKVNFSRKKSDLHEVQLNFKLLKPLGINKTPSLEEIPGYYGLEKIQALSQKWKSILSTTKINIVLHPKSKGSAVEWGMENIIRLIQLLPSEEYEIFITGTEAEGELIRNEIPRQKNVHDLTGKMSLQELISFIDESDALISASTGPLHIAATCGKKAIGLFSLRKPIHPGRWAPIGKKATYLTFEGQNKEGFTKDELIKKISPEDVIQKLRMIS